MEKTIIYKINPTNANEAFFCKVLNNIRSSEIVHENLTYAFMNENMSYAEASAFAHSATALFEELSNNYKKFCGNSRVLVKIDKDKFESYCKNKNWSVKETSSKLYAREGAKFRAKYNIVTKEAYLSEEDVLSQIKSINELES